MFGNFKSVLMIIQGLIGMAIGFCIIIFRSHIKNFTGNIAFAERWLGAGGTWTFLLLVGVAVFILSLMWMFGTLQSGFSNFFGGIL